MSFSPLPTDPAAWRRAGQRVVQYRYAHGTKKNGRRQPLSQADLATRAGVSQGALQAFENSTRATQRESVQRIASAINMTLDQLFAPGADVARGDELSRAHAMFSNAFFGNVDDGSGPFTDEAVAVARLFSVAHTEVRALVKSHLVAHVVRRKDRAAVSLVEELQIAGLVTLDDRPRPTTVVVNPDLVVMPPRGARPVKHAPHTGAHTETETTKKAGRR